MVLRVAVIALSAVLQTLLFNPTAANYGYYKDQVRCLSIVLFPGHGSMTFRGHFSLNLVCPGSYEDIPANAPGDPPGVLYCDQNLPNKEISRLSMPKCIHMEPLHNPMIKMEITFTYTSSGPSYCQSIITSMNEGDLTKFFQDEVRKPEVCPSCSITTEVPEPICEKSSTTNTMMYKYTVGLLLTYDRSAKMEVYEKTWDNIVAKVDESHPTVSSWELERIDYQPWMASCDHIPHSLPTILSLQNTVNCRGCSDSHYADPYGGHRCLQCPFGYYIREYSSKPFYNGPRDCAPCPPHDQFNSREEYLRLCFDRY